MKKFIVPCKFGDVTSPIPFYIGNPESTHNPISFQVNWLVEARGGQVPSEVMESLEKLRVIAVKNNVPIADLCEYALHVASTPTQSTINENQTAEPTVTNSAEPSI